MTTAFTAWPSQSTVANTHFWSPNFASSMQEVLARPGWVWNQHILVMGHVTVPAEGFIQAYTVEQGGGAIPQLVVTYQWRSGGGSVI